MRQKAKSGITLLELILVMAILGILLSIGPFLLPRHGFAVRQEAGSISRLVKWARFEAVRRNVHVGVRVSGTEGFEAYTFDPVDGTSESIRRHSVAGSGAEIASVDGYPVVFDTRGLRDPVTGFAMASI
jgi:type IV fimbrial biogenesis protein FimT